MNPRLPVSRTASPRCQRSKYRFFLIPSDRLLVSQHMKVYHVKCNGLFNHLCSIPPISFQYPMDQGLSNDFAIMCFYRRAHLTEKPMWLAFHTSQHEQFLFFRSDALYPTHPESSSPCDFIIGFSMSEAQGDWFPHGVTDFAWHNDWLGYNCGGWWYFDRRNGW